MTRATLAMMLVLGGAVCAQHPGLLDPSNATETAPDTFRVMLETSKGDAVVEVHRSWSPNGADRFYNLVKVGFYDDCVFFRVMNGFMAQCGIAADPKVGRAWSGARIKDDEVKESNQAGMLSFGTSGPNSRTTHFFINFVDNSNLDDLGFSPFAKVVHGMEAIKKLYSGYGEGAPRGRGPLQRRITAEGNAYLDQEFPKLDRIKRASIIEDDGKVKLPMAVQLQISRTKSRLRELYTYLMIYHTNRKRWPSARGTAFVMKLVKSGVVDEDPREMATFFDPFHRVGPGEKLENVTEKHVGFTGPNRSLKPSMRNAGKYALLAQRLGKDGAAPCGGHGICVIYASGEVEFIHRSAFKDEKVVIGPKSPLPRLRSLKPDPR